jgi:hypothetical protein
VLADVHSLRPLDDPRGVLARWKAQVAEYPEPLRSAILRRFMGEAAFWPGNPHYRTAVERADVLYTSGIVQLVAHALVQVLFALNRVYFPGEKRVAESVRRLERAPRDFSARLETLIAPGVPPGVAALRAQRAGLAALVGEVGRLVAGESPISDV